MPYTMEEFIRQAERRAVLRAPIEVRLEGLTVEQRLHGLSAEQIIAIMSSEQSLHGLSPDQVIRAMSTEQCLGGLVSRRPIPLSFRLLMLLRLQGLGTLRLLTTDLRKYLRALLDEYQPTVQPSPHSETPA